MITEEDLAWWLAKSDELNWTWAKSYATTSPHWWVMQGKTPGFSAEDAQRAGKVIYTFGEPAKFWAMTNVYLRHGRTKWWTMEYPPETTELINMADTSRVYGKQDAPHTAAAPAFYDQVAADYDAMWSKPSDIGENNEVLRLVAQHFGAYAPTMLDVGCGTGLALDIGLTSPALYTGVDPSQGMLNQLVRKHPSVSQIIPKPIQEVAPFELASSYELVTALFAVASYIDYDSMLRCVSLASRMCVLMTYEPGYMVDYYQGQDRYRMMTQAAAATAAVQQVIEEMHGYTFKIGRFDTAVFV